MHANRLIALLLASAALLAVAAIAAVVVLELTPAPPPSGAAAPPSAPPPAPEEPERLRPLVSVDPLQPAPDAPSAFVTLPLAKPTAFCKALEGMGLRNPVFQPNEPPDRGWTCVADILKPVDGDEAAVSSLFVTARGDDDDRVSLLRIKLNLLDASTAPVTREIAKDLLRRMLWALGGQPPDAVLEAIDQMRDGRFTDRGVVYDLRKEFGPSLRANLIVTFPARLGAGGEARFAPPPRP